MGDNTTIICRKNDLYATTASTSTENSEISTDMRCSRHWYILPFVVNLSLLFSASWLVNIIAQNVVHDSTFPFPSWMLFATIAICAPPSLAINRWLPDPAFATFICGLLTSAGLFWTWYETGPMQILTFCVLTGAGISFSVQTVGITLSPYFIRENVTASFVTLLLSALVMVVMCPLITYVATDSNNIFLYFCPVVLITSSIPIVVSLHPVRQSSKNKQVKLLYEKYCDEESVTLSETVLKTDCEDDISFHENDDNEIQLAITNNGWAVSIMSLSVWLTWGSVIDTTWLSLGWRYQYFDTPTGLPAVQLLLCFILVAIKMCSELLQPSTSVYRINLASNCMQLGLLGIAGMILCLIPEYTQSFHNHLLFTAGCALQFDDLSDLCLVRSSSLPNQAFVYRLIFYQIDMNEENASSSSPSLTLCCKICHILTLLLMSILSVILGIQIANLLGFLSTLPPLSFICSCTGLMVMSAAAICVSLMLPNLWKGQKRYVMVL